MNTKKQLDEAFEKLGLKYEGNDKMEDIFLDMNWKFI